MLTRISTLLKTLTASRFPRTSRKQSGRRQIAAEMLETRALLAAFGTGNLAVYRVGDGVAGLSNASAAVFIDEYTPSGTLVQTVAIPTSDIGSNQSLTNSGTATSEGALSLSGNGQFLTFAGYDSVPGVASIASSATTGSTPVARVLGRVDALGNLDTSTTTTSFSTNNIRSVTSTNGTDLWAVGGNSGVVFNSLGGLGAGTVVSTTVINLRLLQVFNGQLYVTTGSGSAVRLGTVGTGTPTTTGQVITNLPGIPTSGSPYGFYFADLNSSVVGVDTVYVADDGIGVTKYSLVSGSWASNGTVGANADDYRGLTGSVSGGAVTLYATRDNGTGADTIVSIVDASGYNSAFSASPTAIITAGANTALRGVAFAPSAADSTPPTVSALSPADNATNVPVSSNLVATFSENIAKGTGNILIKRTVDDGVVFNIPVADAAVSVLNNVVTINPSSDLLNSIGYYVEIPNTAFRDASNNFYAGTVDKNTWNFTTAAAGDLIAPTVTALSPADNAANVAIGSNFVVNFDETIAAGTGNILIRRTSDDSTALTIPVTDSQVSISGAVLTINPSSDLDNSTGYYIQIASTAVVDSAGNAFAGINDATTWNFSTAAPPDVTPPTVSSIVDDRSGAAINANLPVVYTITFSEDINLSAIAAIDFDNAGTASITVGAIAEPTPGVVTVTVTPTSTGTLQLRIPTGAIISDTSGNNLVPAVVDDTTITVNAVTTLTAGDIAFTGIQSDDPDTFSFVLLKDVVNGTQIRFTDNRWDDVTSTLATNESTMTVTFVSTGAGFSAGTHFVNVNGGAAPALRVVGTSTSAGTVSGAISGLSTSGDSLLAYQGATPTDSASSAWIAGINTRSWNNGATGNNQSALPTALTLGTNAIQLSASATKIDNGAYQFATFIGSVSEIRAVVNNISNWTTNDTAGPVSGTTFSIVTTSTDLFVNEVVFNPFAATDTGEEYIELRGTPNTFLPGTAYLLLLDGDSEDTAGNVDHRFYLGGMQFGSNGYLVLRQFGSTYAVDANSGVMTATTSGWGASWSSRSTDIENGSVSVLLIQLSAVPAFDVDVDSDDDGNLNTGLGWTIRDAIGNIDGGASDTGYGLLNTTGNGNGAVATGASLINLGGYHPDYMARNGGSTGYSLLTNTSTDWVVGELAGAMPNATLATGGFTRPAAYEGAALNHIGAVNNFTPGNSAPTNINLSAATLAENAGANAVIGTFSATDPDAGDSFSFSLPVGVDNNNLFNVSGTSLRANASFNFEAGSTYTVTARVTDAGGLTFDKQFNISITNVNEAPSITSGNAFNTAEGNTNGLMGPSTSTTPYLTSTNSNVQFTSIMTVGDAVSGYRMVGIPDGMGAYDNGDGTFTLLLNHELNNTVGINRAHGQKGSFVSRWVINKSTLQVISIQDFLQNGTSVFLSNNNQSAGTVHSGYLAAATTIISRLCSADLAAPTAYQWTDTGTGITYGTAARIFQSGEESGGSVNGVGPETTTLFGRQFAFIATDDPNTPQNEAGTAYELPHAGLFAWENNLANPLSQRKTIVMGMDDGSPIGQVYMWVGDKQTTGNVVERAGLTKQGANDNMYVLRVPSLATVDGSGVPIETLDAPVSGAFTMVNEGDVSGLMFAGLESLSDASGATQFLRPEDGQWDPSNPSDFYFLTTSQYDHTKDGVGSTVGRSRLYKLHFTDISNPEAGGTITCLLDGTEAGNMFDNMTVSNGKVIIQEDVGNQQHLGKIWSYDIATDTLTQIAQHDRARFGDVGVAATSPFNLDEESSGVIDVSDILGAGTYLLNVQAHYNIGDAELVEGGQLLMMQTSVTTGSRLVTTVTATDPDAATTLTYSITGGLDSTKFSNDPATGKLSFVTAPNFEAPTDNGTNNVYDVTIGVSDGTTTTTQAIQVTVTAVNETPTNTTTETVSVAENATAVTTATGSDPEGTTLTYAISGGADAAKFAIVPSTGVLSFVAAPDFEAPTDNGANNSYFVTVTVADGVNAPVNKTVVVNVTNVNESPVASASSVTTNEDTIKTFAASDFLFSDAEGDSLASIAITGLTLAAGDLLTVNQGTGPTPVGVTTIITAAQIGSLTYRPGANATGSGRSTFQFKVNDAGSPGTVTATMTINVTAVNDVPVANDIRLSVGSTTTVTNGAEISAFDKGTKKLFVTKNDGGVPSLDVIDLTNPASPGAPVNINLEAFGGSISSVAVKNGLIVAAMIASTKTAPGTVVFIDAVTHSILGSVAVSSQPDMITFTPDGSKVLVAIEGEAADNVSPAVNNPEGGVAIITPNLSNLNSSTVSFAGFTSFNAQKDALRASGVRLLNNASVTVAMDLEPEYIAISADGTTARVTLQEANAFGVLNLLTGTFTSIQPLGAKDYSLPGNEIDASDRDVPGASNNPVAGNLRSWPVSGLYMPDAVTSFTVAGQTYYVTANEGDARPNVTDTADTDVVRVGAPTTTLDPTVFPNAAFLKHDDNLGRLNVLRDGDTDGDGDLDRLISLGSRSFTIWDATGTKVYDSGSDFERITFAQTPTFFNANNGVASAVDQRSDDKGPEPEGVVVGEINGRSYAFIGLERAGGGVMVYDVTTPTAPVFVQYIRNNGDVSPEGIVFISAADSPSGQPLLVLSNEVSGTVTVYQIATNSVATNEDTAKTFAVSDFLFTDVESDSLVSITISSLNLASGDTLKLGGVDVTVNQTITAANIANLVYTPAAQANGLARSQFGFTVNDAGLGTVAASMTINVTSVNETPTNIALSATSLAENAGANAVIGTFSATDPDAGDTFSFSLPVGVDNNNLFNVSGTSLRANASFNFEAGSTYTITARVTDAGGLTFDKQFSISITNVNEAPSVTSGNTFNVTENTTSVTTVSGSDPDAGTTLTYSIQGGADSSRFTINPTTGVLTFLSAPNFESPNDVGNNNVYDVTVGVSDGVNPVVTNALAVTVTNVNEAVFSSNIFYNLDAAAEKNFSVGFTGQRSIISRIQVVFTGSLTVATGAAGFTLTRGGPGGGTIGLAVESQVISASTTTVVLVFTSGTQFGSLLDGDYRIDINYGVLGIDGNGDGLVGGTRTTYFHRFFGDSDGDRDTDAFDAARFRRVGPSVVSPALWRSLFDFDADGSTAFGADQNDFDAFFGLVGNKHYGKRLADLVPF